MSIQIGTSGSTAEGLRSTSLNYNAAYTVLFRFFLPSGGASSCFMWGLSGTTSYNSGNNFGSRGEWLRFSGGGSLVLRSWDGAAGTDTTIGTLNTNAWNSIAVIRSSASSVIVRLNGSNSAADTTNFASREAVALEVIGWNDTEFNGLPNGCRFTNYKSWSAALSNAEADAEFGATAFTRSTNKYSGSPMGDASTLAGNNTADGSGTAWTLNSGGLVAGANDGSVTYGGGGNNDLASSATAGATASATLAVQRNLAAAAVAGALATGALSVHKPLTGAAIGAAVGAAALTVFSSVWRIPTNAPNGTAVHATVFSGASPTYAILAQGTAVVAGGFVDIPGIGSIGAKAFAFVHNYADNTATSSIRGGPAIATLTSL